MTALSTIRFTLNGRPASAEVAPQHNLVEMLQNRFGLLAPARAAARACAAVAP